LLTEKHEEKKMYLIAGSSLVCYCIRKYKENIYSHEL
jgi:hypothetical protein